MSSSSPCRIQRGKPPEKPLKKTTYRRALPELKRDFKERCAYCMRYLPPLGGDLAMHIDHFDPRRKNDSRQSYSNLFLVDHVCNSAKSNTWPSNSQRKMGLRFLNCCEEMDYGDHMIEDPNTHELIGLTPAGRYQIAEIDLNAPYLVRERRQRFEIRAKLHSCPVIMKTQDCFPITCLTQLEQIVADMIPPIPPKPLSSAE